MNNLAAALKSFFTINPYRKEMLLILFLKIIGLILIFNLFFAKRDESIKNMTGFQVINRNLLQ